MSHHATTNERVHLWTTRHITQLNRLTQHAHTANTALQQALRDFASQLIHNVTRSQTGLAWGISNILFDLPTIVRPHSEYARLRTQQRQNDQAQAAAQHTRDDADARALLNSLPTLKVDDLHQLIADLLQKIPIATLQQRYSQPPRYRKVSPPK